MPQTDFEQRMCLYAPHFWHCTCELKKKKEEEINKQKTNEQSPLNKQSIWLRTCHSVPGLWLQSHTSTDCTS